MTVEADVRGDPSRLDILRPGERRIGHWLAAAACMLVVACAGSPERQGAPQAEAAARVAKTMVGKPYVYGGHSPGVGFDCSGLVYYSYRRVGMSVPRTAREQRSRSKLVSDRQRGDLVFFNQSGRSASHVGIYIGGGQFVHAPSTGKRVRIDLVSSPYWKRHLASVRRFEDSLAALQRPQLMR